MKCSTSGPVKQDLGPSTSPQTKQNQPLLEGLFLQGEVLSRRRKEVKRKDGTLRYLITLTIRGGGVSYECDRWADQPMPPEVPSVGNNVRLAVQPSAYNVGGRAVARLNWGDRSDEGVF